LTPRQPGYPIHCPTCGKLNYLNARKDFKRGRCTLCGSFFDLSREANPLARREIAYPVFIALLTAVFWFLFISQTSEIKVPKSLPPLPGAQNHVAPLSNKFPIPPEPQAAKKFPLPRQTNPAAQSPQSSSPGVPQAEASPSATGSQPQPKQLTGNLNRPASPNVLPHHSHVKAKWENRNPYRRTWRERSLSHQKENENIYEIPLPDSTGN
jgi:cytoskeletal protein RodZ